ncbi:MAG TPA: serine hydrolase [Steroidobacteraceae bacterium]|nr:serine hydrolase [Steroidobacteraceae bacterium]
MRILAVALLLVIPAATVAAPPKGFDARVEALMRQMEVPGATVAIVENGVVTLARGYGLRSQGGAEKVGPDTLFQIGSTTKAFTAAALAILVDEGKLRWDDRVIDHLPGFQMYDPWVTREITVRDLLVHRSGLGLGHGDLLFIPATSLSREETVRRVRFLKPATSFRSAYAYDNILYIVAGAVIEAVSGQRWEEFVEARVFAPLGMERSVTNDPDRLSVADRALPHGRVGEIRGIGAQLAFDEKAVALGENSAPAGAIASGANDLAQWLLVQLAGGKLPGSAERLFSEASAREMWQPVVPLPITPLPGPLADATPKFRNYALGWNVQDYRGHRILGHGGATLGFRATVVLIPEQGVGIAMAMNSEEGPFLLGLQYELLDHYLGLRKRDWAQAFSDFVAQRNAKALDAVRAAAASRPESRPSLPLPWYAGKYADVWYGPIEITEDAGALTIDFLQTPGMRARLEHWAYDTFVARWQDPLTEPAYVTFSLDAGGKPSRITMKAVSPVADFSYDYHHLEFTPVASPP